MRYKPDQPQPDNTVNCQAEPRARVRVELPDCYPEEEEDELNEVGGIGK